MDELQFEGVLGVWHIDTEEEFEEDYNDLITNPDMTYLGVYDKTQDIDDELVYQGFKLSEIAKMSMARYGRVLEILSFEDQYYAFIGNK